jgi:hypothetical protein
MDLYNFDVKYQYNLYFTIPISIVTKKASDNSALGGVTVGVVKTSDGTGQIIIGKGDSLNTTTITGTDTTTLKGSTGAFTDISTGDYAYNLNRLTWVLVTKVDNETLTHATVAGQTTGDVVNFKSRLAYAPVTSSSVVSDVNGNIVSPIDSSKGLVVLKHLLRSGAARGVSIVTTYSPYTFYALKYGYYALYSPRDWNMADENTEVLSLVVNPNVVANEATALGYIGTIYSFNGLTSTITVLDEANSTPQKLYDASQAWRITNFNYTEPVNVVGTSFAVATGWNIVIPQSGTITKPNTYAYQIIGAKVSGTATGTPTNTSVQMTGAAWATNFYVGRGVYCVEKDCFAYITANNGTTLTVDGFKRFANSKPATQLYTSMEFPVPSSGDRILIGYNREDLYNQSLGGISQNGDAYRILGELWIGNGTTPTLFADQNGSMEQIIQATTVAPQINRNYAGSVTILGNINSAGVTSGGVTVVLDSTTKSTSVLNVYGNGFEYTGQMLWFEPKFTAITALSSAAFMRLDSRFVCIDGNFSSHTGARFYGTTSILRNTRIHNGLYQAFSSQNPVQEAVGLNISSEANGWKLFGTTYEELTAADFNSNIADIFVNNTTTGYIDLTDCLHDGNGIMSVSKLSVVQSAGLWTGYVKQNKKINYRFVNTSEAPIQNVRVFLKDNVGASVFNVLSDSNGEISEQKILISKWVSANPLIVTNAVTETTYNPFTRVVRKYGYVFTTDSLTVTSPQDSQLKLATNTYVVANEATAGAYTGIAISGTNGAMIITLSSSKTPQEIYDYTQWWLSQSDNVGYNEFMTPVSAGLFDMGTARFVIPGTLTVDTDPDIGSLKFGTRPVAATNAILVQSGGTLVTGQAGSQGRSIDFASPTMLPSPFLTYADIAIDTRGVWNWISTEIQSHVGIRVKGSINISVGNAKIINEGNRVNSGGIPARFTIDENNELTNIANLETIYFGITVLKTASLLTSVSLENSLAGLIVGGGAPDNVWVNVSAISFINNTLDIGTAGNQWLRFANSIAGTDIIVAGYSVAAGAGNQGLVEMRQGVKFYLPDGAGAYCIDNNNGNRLAANLIGTNPDYVANRAYDLTASGGYAEYVTDGGILTGVFWRSVDGTRWQYNEFDSRGLANDKTDVFPWMFTQYGKQISLSNHILKGDVQYEATPQFLPDLGITQATKATVAAYTGIAPVYSTGILTVTVTENHPWNEIYDYVKYWESVNRPSLHANNQTSFLSTSNKLSYI